MKIIRNLFRKLNKNNEGSGVVLVIVGIAFIGILTGALLTAAGYVYRRTLYDYNSRDNFYYVEQAMDQIYAGIGAMTFECVVDAYNETLENATYYVLGDTEDKGTYTALSEDEINDDFNRRYMAFVSKKFYQTALSDHDTFIDNIKSCITNPTVTLESDGDNISVIMLDEDGNRIIPTEDQLNNVKSIIIKNIAVQRSFTYNRSQANGDFTQTIRADLVVSAPNIDIGVNVSKTNFTDLLSYSVIADCGLDINQTPSNKIVFNGNIYAGNDYYNKEYNDIANISANNEIRNITVNSGEEELNYKINNVLKGDYCYEVEQYVPLDEYAARDLELNQYNKVVGNSLLGWYNGINDHSKHSGIYIDGSDVTFVSDLIIVPGTIGIMNAGKIQTLATNGTKVKNAEIWADNIYLGGYSRKVGSDDVGSQAVFVGDVFVKDDLTLDADNSDFVLKGSYYGFSDGTIGDGRVFTQGVNPDDFYFTDADNNKRVRDHYNSSAIIVNGNNASLDLKNAQSVFVAGRAYIELSKKTTTSKIETSDGGEYETKYYTYKTDVNDYKTGDSVAVKTVQVAYFYDGNITNERDENGNYIKSRYDIGNGNYLEYLDCELQINHQDDPLLFGKFFGDYNGKVTSIPVNEYSTAAGEVRYLIDFDVAYNYAKDQNNPIYRQLIAGSDNTMTDTATKDAMISEFIKAYNEIVTDRIMDLNEDLKLEEIDDYDKHGIAAGDVNLPSNSNIYASGAVTEKRIPTNGDEVSFSIKTSRNIANSDKVIDIIGSGYTNVNTSANAITLAESLYNRYPKIKFSLSNNPSSNGLVDDILVGEIATRSTNELGGDTAITPINTFMDFSKINDSIAMDLTEDGKLKLFIFDGDGLDISTSDANGQLSGIIISSGDISFDSSVKNFSGLIVAAGKVYFKNSNDIKSVSANSEVCKTAIRKLQAMSIDDSNATEKANAIYALSIFNDYEPFVNSDEDEDESESNLGNITYEDVIRFDNWIKEVR